MHKLEYAILDCFRQDPQEKSTSELAEHIIGTFSDKQEKARTHRKLLYHLNKLVKDELLRVNGVRGKGEKLFVLAQEGDITIRSGRKQITIHQPTNVDTPIDALTEAVAFNKENWLHKVNAVFLEAQENLERMAELIEDTARDVNDVIGVLDFETMIGSTDPDVFLDRLRRLACMVVLHINPADMKTLRFCRAYAENRPKNVQLVFTVTPKTMNEQREFLERLTELFMQANIKVNLHNTSIHEAPIICGRAGPYTMSEADWQAYEKIRDKHKGVVVVGASVVLDLATDKPLHKLARTAAETLFLVGRHRTLNVKLHTGFIDEAIRLWNYDLTRETLAQEIQTAQEVADEYSQMQERIYRACGMPTRCKVRLSSAFGKLRELSERSYKKVTVYGLSTLQEAQYTNYLKLRETLAKHFLADRVRIFRHGEGTPQEVFREAAFILNSYTLPYITYDFSELRGDVKLTEYLR